MANLLNEIITYQQGSTNGLLITPSGIAHLMDDGTAGHLGKTQYISMNLSHISNHLLNIGHSIHFPIDGKQSPSISPKTI